VKITLLGTGTSSGVPRIGNDWGNADPNDPRNRRRRVSILVESGDTTILVDTGPDMREQLLDARVSAVDAVFYTHDHADHTHGIDDLRGLFNLTKKRVQCYANDATLAMLHQRFGYIFKGEHGYPSIAQANRVADTHRIGRITVRSFRQIHGMIDSVGYRFEADGAVAVYSTDVNAFGRDARPLLAGTDLWVLDCLRRKPHPSHPHLDLALKWIDEFAPKRTLLTHMDSSMDHATLAAELPPGIEPGYDMQMIELGS
jgi:phosphoribosyl 1,2-cyclic phosphate phosphodiesterase